MKKRIQVASVCSLMGVCACRITLGGGHGLEARREVDAKRIERNQNNRCFASFTLERFNKLFAFLLSLLRQRADVDNVRICLGRGRKRLVHSRSGMKQCQVPWLRLGHIGRLSS